MSDMEHDSLLDRRCHTAPRLELLTLTRTADCLQAVMANGLSASGSPDPTTAHAAPQSYGRGQFGSGVSRQYRGSHSLELPPYTSIGPPSHGGADMRSTSIDTAMELTRVRSAACQ